MPANAPTPESDALWSVRATAWELLAFSLRYPDAELAEAVASGEWAEAAAEVADVLKGDSPQLGHFAECGVDAQVPRPPERSAAGAESKDPLRRGGAGERTADALLHALRAEATRLFVGAPDAACSPYEGVWRAADDGVQALLFVNPHSMEVERFMRSCGLGRPEGTNEPLDHAATECELLQHLAMLEAGLAEPPGGVAADALPGGSPAAAYASFLDDHARAWMPRFAEHLAAESREPFYRAAAQLLGAMTG
ncbi:molecular chaperone TorD [Gordonibacter sp. 28C]|nr:molecular chaperone TorD [Gordonibacter sp. 28C]